MLLACLEQQKKYSHRSAPPDESRNSLGQALPLVWGPMPDHSSAMMQPRDLGMVVSIFQDSACASHLRRFL